MKIIFCGLTLLLTVVTTRVTAQFNVQMGSTSTQMIISELMGVGVAASNVTSQFHANSAGVFTSTGVPGFPFAHGIVLSTGDVTDSLYGSSAIFNSTDMGLPGDSTLDMLVFPSVTEEAVFVEFDFLVANDSLKFEFIFSSEEYNEYANTNFNDVFGFFVTGPGYAPNTNVALLPGTTTPIGINTVNNGGPVAGPSIGPCMNCSYYIDNVSPLNNVGLSPDGFTTPITIQFAVQPCTQYHIKIALADVSDGIFDSQIFLKGESFQACGPMQFMVDSVYHASSDTIAICPGQSLTLTAPQQAQSYNWSNGQTTQSISITQPGAYSMYVFGSSNCFAFSDVIYVVMADSVQTPVLTGLNDTIFSGITQSGLTFTWTLNGTTITGANQPYLATTQPGCYVLEVSNQTGCAIASNVFCLTGLSEINSSQITISPNPVSGISIVELPSGDFSQAELYSYNGQLAGTISLNGKSTFELDSREFSPGLYLLVLTEKSNGAKRYCKVVMQ